RKAGGVAARLSESERPARTACTFCALAKMVSDSVGARVGLEGISGTNATTCVSSLSHGLYHQFANKTCLQPKPPLCGPRRFHPDFLSSHRLNEVNHEFPQSRFC